MLLTTTLSFAQTNSLTLGCPTRNGNSYQYQDLSFTTSTDFVVTSISVSFSDDPASCSIALPTLPTGWSVDPSSNEYSKYIILPEGTDDVTIRDFLSGITYTVPDNSIKNVQIILLPVAAGKIIRYSENGHYYQFVPFTQEEADWTWIDCYNAAKEMTYCGRQGYLATLTSLGEDKFVTRLVSSSMWIGGTRLSPTDDATSTGTQYYASFDVQDNYRATNALSGDYWYWACGPEKGTRITNEVTNSNNNTNWYANQPSYSNWCWKEAGFLSSAEFEPNNARHGLGASSSYESCLTILNIGRNSVHNHTEGIGWNDIGYDRNIMGNFSDQDIWLPQGFMVEYGNQIIGDTNPETDECSISASGKVGNANDTSRVTLSGNDTICVGESATLTLLFEGAYPFTGKVTGGGQEYPFTTNDVFYTFTVTPTETTTYTVSEFSDASSTTGSDGCPGVYNIIYETSGSATVTVNELTATVSVTDETCKENNDGIITVNANGGIGSYQYQLGTGTSQTSNVFTGLAAGDYTVTVTDANGCTTTTTATIGEPAQLTLTSVTATDAKCNGASNGSVELSVSGGTTPYSYEWSNGATTEDLSSVPAGTYTVTVTDDNGCTATASATVSQPAALTVSLEPESETCAGNDGSVALTVSGGTTPYSYEWSNGDTTKNLSSVPAGPYTVTVTDRNTCVATATATITLNKNFTVSASNTAVCSGEPFTVAPTTSHTAKYSWAAPTATGITGATADTNASNISGTLTNTNTSATSITYTVAATTANGLCTADSFDVVVTVYAPVTGGSIQKDFISCNVADTIVTLTNVTAGNGGYGGTYGWEKSTDNGTTWTPIPNSNGVDYTPNYHDNLGTVLYRRMYNANCDEKPSNTVSVTYYGNVNPGTVVCSGEGNDCAANYCSGSNISVTLSTSDITIQSNASYSIQWQQSTDNGATWTNISGETSDTYTYTNPNFTSSIQFRYTITVTGCAPVPSNSVHKIGVWKLPVVSIAEVATLCPSAASTEITGTIETPTTPNYTYYWIPGSGLTLPNLPDPNLPESATSETSNTITGTFSTTDCNATYSASLYVIDGNGCKSNPATKTFTVVDTEAPVISGTLATIDVEGCTVSAAPSAYTTVADLRTAGLTIEDNCGLQEAVTSKQTSTGSCPIVITRTYTVKDLCGDSATVSQTININQADFTMPADTGSTVACPSATDTPPTLPVVKDACGNVLEPIGDPVVSTKPVCEGKRTYTYTYRDCAGHSHEWVYTYTVERPTLTFSGSINDVENVNACYSDTHKLQLLTAEDVKAMYTSSCSREITVSTNDEVVSSSDCNWKITRTYNISDGGCNIDSKTMSVSGSDRTDPFITCNENLTPNTDDDQPYATVTLSDPTYGDNCSATYSISYSPAPPTNATATNASGQYPLGVTTVTYSVVDGCGNADSCSFTITVSDNQAPEIACAVTGNQDVLPNSAGNTYTHSGNSWDATATDNVAVVSLTYTLTDATVDNTPKTTLDGQVFNYGTTTVTWEATDNTGKKDQCSFQVVVADNTKPGLTCPTITTVYECLAEVPATYANYAAFTAAGGIATDNHQINESSLTVTETVVTGCPTTITRTYSIKDMTGNAGTCTQVITVEDKTAPALTGTWPANITGQNNCFANRNISGLLSNDAVKDLYTDNCGGELTVDSSDVVTGDDCGWTVTRTYTIKDSCGNTVMPKPTMSVSGSDQSAPALTEPWPANITDQDNCLANADISGLYSNEAVKALYSDCSTITVTHTDANTLTDDCGWTITRAYTIKDACGNTVTPAPAMSVSGSDQTAPALAGTWPDNITGKNSCLANADTTGLKDDSEIKALYNDCSEITVTHTDTIEGDACGWIVTRIYTIKDSCGNTVTPAPAMSVSGSDQTAPAIGTDDLDRTLTATNCVFKIPDMREIVRNISTDCSEITVTQPSAGMVVYPMVAERDTTVNVIVTDSCGNSSVKEVVITIPAKVTISATATPATICYGATSQLTATPSNVVGTATYNWTPSDGLNNATIANPVATLTTTTTYTVEVTDENGCAATATTTVTVNPEVVMDTVAPMTLCVDDVTSYSFTTPLTVGTMSYAWTNSNTAIGLGANGDGDIPSFTPTNTTNAPINATISVTPSHTYNDITCVGDPINFTITVRPSITTPGNVTFTCPADTTVVLSYSDCEQLVNIGEPEFVNNMSGMNVNITNDAPAGNIFPEGTTIVTWTATDECGATLTCTQNVVIQFPPCGDTIADFDGYRYSSVRIGCQCWTGENARSEHYSDGTPVDNFRYYNDSDSLENIYGKLYTWYTAVRVPEGDNNAEPSISTDPFGNSYVQGICPEGWALPTVNEYMQMIANSGDATHAKDGSNLYWLPGYEGQPPFSGFDAYGAGKYNGAIDRYQELLGKTHFWTTLSGSGSETATTVEINYYCAEGLQTELSKGDGVSIRCIRKR